MSFRGFIIKSNIFVVQPTTSFSPAYPIAKVVPGLSIILPRSPQALVDALLQLEAKPPVAILHPQPINCPQILTGKVINIF